VSHQSVLVTGGAGFVGSNLAIRYKNRYPGSQVSVLDNLRRRGSELNISRLREAGIEFIHGDIRNREDFPEREIDLVLECSAEPSVLAGYGGSPDYLINTNLVGTLNCLELARRHQADFVFLSTSRVYPLQALRTLNYSETETRFVLDEDQPHTGVSGLGIAETFPLQGARSLYGATKLASELFVEEYRSAFHIRTVIDRCGVITGPWQMGKTDQGVFALWLASHYFGGELHYIGYGGRGKQVRDFLHIDDLFELIDIQTRQLDRFDGQIFNVGGGLERSLSLLETTTLCEQITGHRVTIHGQPATRVADIPLYITDHSKITDFCGWQPSRDAKQVLTDVYKWIADHEALVRGTLTQ
jgi:CDP-paratose 2-epimerase